MAGCVLCAGKNSGIPPFHDNDWTFNLGGPSLALLNPTIAGLDVQEIRTRDAPGNGPAETIVDPDTGLPALHCEIGSRIGDYAAVGGAIGSVAGAIAGRADRRGDLRRLGTCDFRHRRSPVSSDRRARYPRWRGAGGIVGNTDRRAS